MKKRSVSGRGASQWGRGQSVGEGPINEGEARQWGRDYFLNDREMQSKFDANMFEAAVE